jgi:hypothetical protein
MSGLDGQADPVVKRSDLQVDRYRGAFGDLDDDGVVDAVCSRGEVQIAFGEPGGTFLAPVEVNVNGPHLSPYTMILSELDASPGLDLVMGPSRPKRDLGVLFGEDGSLGDAVAAPSPGDDWSYAGTTVVDYDDDGDLEILVYAEWCP